MGHYYSEMNGLPFERSVVISAEVGETIMNDKDLAHNGVRYCKVRWITTDPERIWLEVHYLDPKYGYCFITVQYDDYKHLLKDHTQKIIEESRWDESIYR